MVRSTNAQRQTMNAMKQMQLLVRIQTQIQSRRVQMLENQAIQHDNKEMESNNLSRWAMSQLVSFCIILCLVFLENVHLFISG